MRFIKKLIAFVAMLLSFFAQAQQTQTMASGYQKMTLKLPFSNQTKEYLVQKQGHYYILNDDIIVGNDFPKTMSYGQKDNDFLWKNADVAVAIAPNIFANNLQDVVYQAIDEINSKTEICITPYTNQEDFITIEFNNKISGSGQSPCGKQGGEQKLFLNSNAPFGTVVHELLHAFGIWHEQSRSDRNNFVKILDENVRAGTENNFQIEPGNAQGTYDYCSIMHYSTMAFSKNSNATIQCLDNGTIVPCQACVGQRNGLSALDISGIDRLYSSVSRFSCNTRYPKLSDVRKDANVTAVSATKGGVTLFVVGEDSQVWTAYYDPRIANPKWEGWFPLGGNIKKGTNISAISTVEGGVSLFAVGIDDAVWSAYYDPRIANPKWSSWFSLGGKVRTGSNVAAVSATKGGSSLFVIGTDGAIYSAYYDPRIANPKWSNWFSLGGQFRANSDVTAISAIEGGVSLFSVGMDGSVWSTYYDPRVANPKWENWFSLGGKVREKTSVSAVSATEGGVSLFVVGTEGGVYSAYYDPRIANPKWSEWFGLGGKIAENTTISAVSAVEGGVSLFGIGTDNGVYSAYFDPRIVNPKWSSWFSLSKANTIRKGATVKAVSAIEGGVALFSIGQNSMVLSAYFDPRIANAKWSEWFKL